MWVSDGFNLLQVIPGRMTLLITIFLVLINIFNTIQTNSPQVGTREGGNKEFIKILSPMPFAISNFLSSANAT